MPTCGAEVYGGMRCGVLLLLIIFGCSAAAQQADVALAGGGGYAFGDDQNSHGVASVGTTFGFPFAGRHRLEIDYTFQNAYTFESEKRHFLTGSYVRQARARRARPLFAIGAGLVHRSFTLLQWTESDTSLAILFGAGATIDLRSAFFIRPQIRIYAHVGPTLTILPSVGFGYKF